MAHNEEDYRKSHRSRETFRFGQCTEEAMLEAIHLGKTVMYTPRLDHKPKFRPSVMIKM